MVLAINTSADPWGTLIVLAILVLVCAFPFIIGAVVGLATKGLELALNVDLDHDNVGIAAGFFAVFIEFFALVVFVIPRYS